MTVRAVLDGPCSQRVYHNEGNPPLLALLPGNRGGAVLDCGCGAGDNARALASMGWTVDGVTISADEASLAERYCRRVEIANLEAGLPRLDTSYDVVLMSHVLEHLVSPGPLLSDVRTVLKPAGRIVVALPNVLLWRNRLAFLCGSFEYTQEGIMDSTHVRFYTHASGRRLLERHGFKVIHSSASGGVGLGVLRRWLPERAVSALDRTGCRWWPGLLGMQSLYVGVVAGRSSIGHGEL
jgi:2-polyprenyl-3-methyl-5-hydroxy-6-metoxy-1,4-benzoquinol methylase